MEYIREGVGIREGIGRKCQRCGMTFHDMERYGKHVRGCKG